MDVIPWCKSCAHLGIYFCDREFSPRGTVCSQCMAFRRTCLPGNNSTPMIAHVGRFNREVSAYGSLAAARATNLNASYSLGQKTNFFRTYMARVQEKPIPDSLPHTIDNPKFPAPYQKSFKARGCVYNNPNRFSQELDIVSQYSKSVTQQDRTSVLEQTLEALRCNGGRGHAARAMRLIGLVKNITADDAARNVVAVNVDLKAKLKRLEEMVELRTFSKGKKRLVQDIKTLLNVSQGRSM